MYICIDVCVCKVILEKVLYYTIKKYLYVILDENSQTHTFCRNKQPDMKKTMNFILMI